MASTASAIQVLGKADTLATLYRVIDEARQHVWLVSPTCSLGTLRDLSRRLAQALERRVKVTLVVRRLSDGEPPWSPQDVEEARILMEKGMELFEVADLHSRAYYSEVSALVTSLNLVERSFTNNIDVGVLMNSEVPQYAQLREVLRAELHEMFQVMDVERLLVRPPAPGADRAKVAPGLRRRRSFRKEDATDKVLHTVLREADACHRCGRTGHWALECYARKDIHGVSLDRDEH